MFGCRLARGRGLRLTGRRYARRAAFRRQRSGSAWRSRPIPGRTRRPVRGVGGLWIGDASRYPVFSARERRRIAFGPESTHRPGGIDDAWHKSADAAGVVILDTEAVDRGRQARLDRRAGGGGQSDTQGDKVGGANRCIQGGQPLHQHAIRPIKPVVRPSDDPDLDRGGRSDGRPSGKPADRLT